ncbi:MAG: ABC transporter ATP-binding protein [Demequinaceae bacterium]|nr:ABC transporter ATP-binding protein [Demequinaceae bacterium]
MIESLRGAKTLAHIAWNESRGRVVLSFLLMTLQFVAMPLAAPALAALTNAAIRHDASAVTGAALAVAALTMASLVAGHFGHIFYFELGEMVQLAIERDLIDISNGSAGLEHHERPDYADKLRVIRQEVNWAGWMVMSILFSSIGLAMGMLITIFLLSTLNPWLLLLPVFAIPSLILGRMGEVGMGKAREAAAPHTRKVRHVFHLVTDAGPAKEIRVCGLGEEMHDRQKASWKDATDILVKGEDRSAFLQVIGQLLFAVAYIGATLLVIRNVVADQGTVGDVVLVISLASQVNAQVTQAVFLLVGLQRVSRTLANLAWMRALVEKDLPTPDLPLPKTIRKGITLRDVSFAYPGTERKVLGGVNLELPAGTTVAIVGENGAGKTTLVKLLCRFYEQTSGAIEMDGVDMRRFPLDEWRGRIAAGFQDFARFEFIAREVVGIGDLPKIESTPAVKKALHRARGDDLLTRLEDGLETQIGKSYADGTELSGGQWQKLALGRAMMRETPLLLVLDEPTSALDAQAEHNLFEEYAASAKRVAKKTGAITILVSHRFSTVRMADLILVVNDGRIQEAGSHQELMKLGGLYADLYSMQAKAYS